MWRSILLLALALEVFRATGFEVTYPHKGDVVSIYDGLTTTWTYNSSDSIKEPMEIAFFQISHLEEEISYTVDGVNITAGTYTLRRSFTMADGWYLRYTFGDEMYLSETFQLTLGQPSNASESTTTSTFDRVTTTISTPTMVLTSMDESSTMQVTPTSADVVSTASSTEVAMIDPGSKGGLSMGSKAGIGAGCAAAVILGLMGLYLIYKARKKRSSESAEEKPARAQVLAISELDGASGAPRKYELEGNQGVVKAHELPAQAGISNELPG
ncbi:uncharacterized protein BO72DRAFT_62316 [Aspergillus fijiensis CBS 313.89]|uniref:Mid2 domain-containing protein n=1 Tax=Aspergillus fijiensis CBS 313.89 TaxID=1448319 RepID=A0A8G1RT27_9EURO|nr:uncharacterized protein BO72DRAFT_62316 [Aspergillus fijiensis CBS 313.89]RAK78965.1 hypothetical protein BO72DRAFT_62316 [Aspergillus fijiensis CBS 313.89]